MLWLQASLTLGSHRRLLALHLASEKIGPVPPRGSPAESIGICADRISANEVSSSSGGASAAPASVAASRQRPGQAEAQILTELEISCPAEFIPTGSCYGRHAAQTARFLPHDWNTFG